MIIAGESESPALLLLVAQCHADLVSETCLTPSDNRG